MLSLQQIRWCSWLVRKVEGHAGEVGHVASALYFAYNDMRGLSLDNIKFLAVLTNANVKGWRTIDVKLNNIPVGSPPDQIESHLTQLIEAWDSGHSDPRHLYWEYEAIHPFGTNVNHIVGCIIYNWCNRSCGSPVFPPAYMMGDANASSS